MRTILVALLALSAGLAPSSALIIRVPSQAPSIQAAVNWSASGDTLLVEPGTYTGIMNRSIRFNGKNVILRSEGGADVTEMDCEGAAYAFLIEQGEQEVVEGLTIRNGYCAYGSGGMQVKLGGSATVRSCRFVDNGGENGVLYCASSSHAVFEDCLFLDNWGDLSGVAQVAVADAEFVGCEFSGNTSIAGSGVFRLDGSGIHSTPVTLTECVLRENSGGAAGVLEIGALFMMSFHAHDCVFERNASGSGIIDLYNAFGDFSGCLFAGNVAGSFVVGRHYGGGGGWMAGSTFVENVAPEGVFDAFYDDPVSNTVVAFTVAGPAILDAEPPPFSCCDLYGNEGGDWVGGVASQLGVNGNICADPLFCGDDNAEFPYSLHGNSPCAAANSGECGTIGVWDEGCSATPAEAMTWGAIKARHR